MLRLSGRCVDGRKQYRRCGKDSRGNDYGVGGEKEMVEGEGRMKG